MGKEVTALAGAIDPDDQREIESFLDRQRDVCMEPRASSRSSFSTSICFCEMLNGRL